VSGRVRVGRRGARCKFSNGWGAGDGRLQVDNGGDGEGTHKAVGELAGSQASWGVLREQQDPVADLEAGVSASSVCVLALAVLGGGEVLFSGGDGVGDAEEEVISGGHRSGRTVDGVQRRDGVLTVGEERRECDPWTPGVVVVGELGRIRVLVPGVLMVGHEAAQDLLNGVVGPLSLAIGLRVVGGGEVTVGVGGGAKGYPKLGREERVTV